MITIYLSSTYEDLKEYRSVVLSELRRAGYQVIAMEDNLAAGLRPIEECLADVQRSDIYVGIFAFRYGDRPPREHNNPDDLSFTELEFRHADKVAKIPCLTFVVSESTPWANTFNDAWTEKDKGEHINQLRKHLLKEKKASCDFSSSYQLASLVQASVKMELEKRKPLQRNGTVSPGPPPTITWDIEKNGSPYPGLMHFTRKFKEVFCGREAEVLEVLDRIHRPEGRFIIISGNSGTGKSSLVDAGVLPRILETGFPGDKSCMAVRMVPGANAFDAIKGVLYSLILQAGRDPDRVGENLLAGPESFSRELNAIISDGTDKGELVLFLDQMEELFTSHGKGEELASTFVSSLYSAVHETSFRVIATIRGDFLHHCHQHPDLLQVLKSPGHYPLGPLELHRIHDVIEKPAQRAGLTISNGLVARLIKDAGSDSGNLPLLAFVLQRLFMEREDSMLSADKYEAFGGINGAIADQVSKVEKIILDKLGQEELERLPAIFQPLLVINVDGQPTRRRALKAGFPDDLLSIVDLLVPARLLTTEGEGEESTVSVAHEKLFEAWPVLARWIADNRDDLLMVRQAELEAREWEKHDHALLYLWPKERLKKLQEISHRLVSYDISPLVSQYAYPQDILLQSITHATFSHSDRLLVGQHLAELGDPRSGVGLTANGLPDIDWVDIPGGTVKLEDVKGTFTFASFRIARYPITNSQFQVFVDSKDGYYYPEWWKDIERSESSKLPAWSEANCPRESVSWYEAVAFCRWLTQKYYEHHLLVRGKEIRLPKEWEWQQAATCGDPVNLYPWKKKWGANRCNSQESGLNRTTAVGMYPHGTWPGGAHDMSGNVWEWCLNKNDNPRDFQAAQIDISNRQRALRGGYWGSDSRSSRLTHRHKGDPRNRLNNIGFRLAQEI